MHRRIFFAPDGGTPGGGGDNQDPGNGNPNPGNVNPDAGNVDPPAPPAWLNDLPDDLKGNDRLMGVADVGTLASRFVNAIELPGDDAKPEERDAALDSIANRLGRPEKADGYTIPEVENRPYTDADKALQQQFMPLAHTARLTQQQMNVVVGFHNKLQELGIEHQAKIAGTTEAALRKEHGDQFNAKLELGNRALVQVLEKIGMPLESWTSLQLADGSYLGDGALANALFIGIGELIGETRFAGAGGGAGGGGARSAAEVLYPNQGKEK